MICIISAFHVIILHIVIISNTISIMTITRFRRNHFWIVSIRTWSRGKNTKLSFPLALCLTFLNRLIFCGFGCPVAFVSGRQGGLSLISTSASTEEKYPGKKKVQAPPWIWRHLLFWKFPWILSLSLLESSSPYDVTVYN